MHKIVIIGGGFSGTLTAVNLARLAQAPLQVTIINDQYPSGLGVAYSTRRPEHLLNVAARNMSALPDHPHHFLDWLRTRSEFAEMPETELRETFMPRRVYGEYLRGLALQYTMPVGAQPQVEIRLSEGTALDIVPAAGGLAVCLAGGNHVMADKVVLATGNEPPADLPGAESLADHPAWCANPWIDWQSRRPADGSAIILLGTGLTMVDAVLTLSESGWQGTIHAVSRNGLLPQSHFKGIDYPHFPPKDIDLASLGLDALTKLVELHCARVVQLGGNPGIIVDKMRPHTQRIWQAFSFEERRSFTARYASRWNVIRHRIAPSIHQQMEAAIASGKLVIHRAAVTHVEPAGENVRVILRSHDQVVSEFEGALVVNGTGPASRFTETRSRLLRNLLTSGLLQADTMNMGVRVAPDFAVVDREGNKSGNLFALGPLLKGTFWESIAVPELRGQAMQLAQTLLEAIMPDPSSLPRWTPGADEAAMEYFI